VSRGLGPTQQHLLLLLDDGWRRDGLAVSDVPTLLGVGARYARRVIARLVDLGLVVVSDDDGEGRRVWLPHRRRRWVSDRRYVRHLLDTFHDPVPPQRFCGNCGVPIPR